MTYDRIKRMIDASECVKEEETSRVQLELLFLMNFIFRKDKSKGQELTDNALRIKKLSENLHLKDYNKFISAIIFASLSLHE